MRTRFAPTPSGFLHEGNAANALLAAWWARELGGTLVLRVDDLDAARMRPEYVSDLDEVLAWLGIEPAVRCAPQAVRMPAYELAREALIDTHRTFACACSRTDLAHARCRCRERDLRLETGSTCLRWASPSGDVVVWRRDGIPAYHLASVVDDDAFAITHIVRGQDLAEATVVQRALAIELGLAGIATAVVVHHPLAVDATGRKLSKSQLRAGPMPRTDATLARVVALARELAAASGITPSESR